MAHLINAKAMRIGWEQDWCDLWFSKDKYYCDYLYSCFRIRYFLIYFFFSKHIDKIGFIYSHFFISVFYKIFSVYLYFYDSGLEIKHDNFKREYRKLVKSHYRSSSWSIISTTRWVYNKFFKNRYWFYDPSKKLLNIKNRPLLPYYHVNKLVRNFREKGITKFQVNYHNFKMHILYVFMGILFYYRKPPAYIKKKLEERLLLKKLIMKEL
jgi:hypothetical protein